VESKRFPQCYYITRRTAVRLYGGVTNLRGQHQWDSFCIPQNQDACVNNVPYFENTYQLYAPLKNVKVPNLRAPVETHGCASSNQNETGIENLLAKTSAFSQLISQKQHRSNALRL